TPGSARSSTRVSSSSSSWPTSCSSMRTTPPSCSTCRQATPPAAPASRPALPVVSASGRAGRASGVRPADGTLPDSPDLQPLLDVLLDTVPPPADDPDAPLQAHVTNLDATSFLGRIALCRIRAGTIRRGQQVAWCQADGTISRGKVTEL